MPPHYVADIGERLYVVQPERSIYSDVVVIEHPSDVPLAAQEATVTMPLLMLVDSIITVPHCYL